MQCVNKNVSISIFIFQPLLLAFEKHTTQLTTNDNFYVLCTNYVEMGCQNANFLPIVLFQILKKFLNENIFINDFLS